MNRAILCFAARTLAVLVPLGVVAFVGCSDDDPAPANVVDAGVVLSDPQIVAVLNALNGGEVAQGELAMTRATASDVRDYASIMVTTHRDALERIRTIVEQLGLAPDTNPTSEQVRTDVDGIMTSLQSASDQEFDTTYLASQVIMHTRALELLDEVLIPSTQTPELLSELTTEREVVAMHLQQAEALMSPAPDAGPTEEAGRGDAL